MKHRKAKTSRREAKLAIVAGENTGSAIRACFRALGRAAAAVTGLPRSSADGYLASTLPRTIRAPATLVGADG